MTKPATTRRWAGPAVKWSITAVLLAALLAVFWRSPADPALTATVTRGELTATLTSSGTLKPIQSITYRSPIPGRDLEIRELAPEGSKINDGDLLVRLDTTDLEVELARLQQELRQAQMDQQVAEGEWDEAGAEVKAVTEGEGALTVEEARTTLLRAQKKAERLREEYASLRPLLDKGFITRDELARTSDQLDQAEDELNLARRRADVVVQLSHPREQKRAALQLSQKVSQLGLARTRVQEMALRVATLSRLIEGCTIHARGPGMVVYEELLTANPRRKLRVGDRVFATQGIVTIPEVNRMLVEASVSEAEVHRVSAGQAAMVRVEAFPDLKLTGKVTRVGALASASAARPFDDKRFDLIIALDPTTAELRPEMSIRADVIVGGRQDVLLVPVTAIFSQDGHQVVYLETFSGAEARQVEIGQSNDRVAEVTSGLREGDRVRLTEPGGPVKTPMRGDALQPR